MTQMEPKSLSNFNASEHKKMITGIVLSVSICSFAFSYSSLLHSQNQITFSSNNFHILKRALNKNYLFLICNGLLVFLAKTSRFVIRSHSGYDLNDMLQNRVVDDILQTSPYAKEEIYYDKDVKNETFEADGENGERAKEGGKEIPIFIAESDHEFTEANDETEFEKHCIYEENGEKFIQEEESYDENVDNQLETEISTEELNQKCEDFIKRMKKEIIISEIKQLALAK